MQFNFFNPVKIHFNINFKNALNFIAQKNAKILLVSTKGQLQRTPQITQILGANLAQIIDCISPNPKIQDLQILARDLGEFDAIIAFGGGSVMDSAKFFMHKRESKNPNFYAFPTTFGTSSELTKWATIWDFENGKKHSLSDENLHFHHAFYDINLSLNCPRELSIFTSLDALTHAFESIWNKNANPISSHFALKAIEIILRDLARLSENLSDLKLRENIALASVFAGLAFSATQTALAHAISYPLTMKFGVPHGLACSFSLPLLLENLPLNSHAREILSPFQTPLNALFSRLKISINPRDYGLNSALIDEIFDSLNERAKNGIFDLALIKAKFKAQI